MSPNRKPFGWLKAAAFFAVFVALFAWLAQPELGLSQAQKSAEQEEDPLPTRVVIDVDSPERALYRIAVPELLDQQSDIEDGAAVIRSDLHLSSLFKVLDPRSFVADFKSEGLGLSASAWSVVGAQGVVKGKVAKSSQGIKVEMRLYEIARGEAPLITRTYNGKSGELRRFMHEFANEILRVLTGKAGAFGSRLTFARRVGPGRKDVYVASFDGHSVGRVSSGKGIAMLPNFGPGGIWYSVLSQFGMFITNTKAKERPMITGNGLNMGVSICGNRAYFTSTRNGNSEIYSASLDGKDVLRLTNSPAIDVSPTCGPGGQIAFVSTRHGGPQIFIMSANGGTPKRVTYKGSHNQTPAWCPDPTNPLIAFSGRAEGDFDVFTVNLKTGQYTRLTQGQGLNKDPAFSPDCRMVAFASSRGGIFLSNPEGLNQNLVIKGAAETVRWSR
ncbi:MAG: PD40 domain-containing protein [Deltaproteobacteria bacterium]|nr:PD40 domain-containing protein [Deltaproteobacteria bacterium]